MFDVGLMRVQDRANIIPATDEIALARESEALEKATTDELVVVTVPTLNGADITTYSAALGNKLAYEMSTYGSTYNFLKVRCPQFISSEFFPGHRSGEDRR